VRAGNYEIDHEVGGGLYHAKHTMLPRRAMVKTIPASIGQVQSLRVALLREACIMEALEHRGVARVFETGVLDDGRPWFAFEDIDGTALADAGPLALPQLLAILVDLCDVLEHAHRRGVIHAGLHPDRIVLTQRAFGVCLDDWSCARTHDASAPLAMSGSQIYTAPELIAGDRVDDRADIFAIGMLGKCALVGTAPDALTWLLDQMIAPARGDRPAIAEVREALAAVPVASARPRWTPPFGLARASEDEVAQEEVVLIELD
jgi:serine/threonine protein kinase